MSTDATRATWKLSAQVTAIQKLLLLALADRAGEDGECWPSLKRLEADTNLNRKTLIDNRKKLIGLGLLEFTGEMKGKKKQIPVMRLTYINQREKESTSPENGTCTSTEIGTRTSTEIGTRTSTEIGTLNLKEESKKRIISESGDSPHVIQDDKSISNIEMIDAFIQIFPNHPHPDIKKPDAALVINLNKLRKSWAKEISSSGKSLTLETFMNYLKNMVDIKHYMTDPNKNYEMVSFITLKTVKSVKAMVEAKQRRSNYDC